MKESCLPDDPISVVVKNLALLIASLAILLIGYSYYVRSVELVRKVEAEDAHEYQLIQLSNFRRDQYLLDKKTGRLWSSVCAGESKGVDCDGGMVWDEESVVGLNGYTREH